MMTEFGSRAVQRSADPQCARELQVPTAFANLEHAVGELDERTMQLVNRLDGVLRPHGPVPANPNGSRDSGAGSPTANIAAQLSDLRQRVVGIIERISDAHDRLEI